MKSENLKQDLSAFRVNKKKILKDKFGRNETCPCGSGKKFKSCCFSKHYIDPQLYHIKSNTFIDHYTSKLISKSNLDDMFAGFRKQLAELSQSTLMIYLNNLLPMYIENFFISKRLLEKQAKDSQKKDSKDFQSRV